MGITKSEIGSGPRVGVAIAAIAVATVALWTGGCSLEKQPYPGPGPSTSSTTTVGTPCVEGNTCADTDGNPCTSPVCSEGLCAEQVDDTVIPQPPSECASYRCVGGTEEPTYVAMGTGCGADPEKTSCDGDGNCVGCTEKKDCLTDTDCQTWACVGKTCTPTNVAADTTVPDAVGNCTKLSCDGNGGLVTAEDMDDAPPDEDPPNPCTTGVCEGLGNPKQQANVGQACGNPGTCVDFVETAPDTCDQDGLCQPGATSPCPPFACDAATQQCAESCTPATADQDCVNAYCEGTTCAPTKGNGEPCGAAGECIAGFCVDGVCCNSACDTACNSCDLGGGTAGICAFVPKGVVDECPNDQACNSGACSNLASKIVVGEACVQDFDCFNTDGTNGCFNGLCRLTLNVACEPATFWYCTTKFCDSTGVCAQCTDSSDCPGGACMDLAGVNRCTLGAGAPCGADADCASNDCNLAAGSPGTCQ